MRDTAATAFSFTPKVAGKKFLAAPPEIHVVDLTSADGHFFSDQILIC